jgi:hypothetical protein
MARFSPDSIAFMEAGGGYEGVLIGKGAYGHTIDGIELATNGRAVFTTSGGIPPILANRKTSDGSILDVYRDNVYKARLWINGASLTTVGAVLAHPSEWADPAFVDPEDMLGTVVCSTDEYLDDDPVHRHPLCRISTTPGDPCVYGVLSVRADWPQHDPPTQLIVEGAGSGLIKVLGPVRHGDLLETSNLPGVAWSRNTYAKRPADRQAAIVAKARQEAPDDGKVHLIRCTLLAG